MIQELHDLAVGASLAAIAALLVGMLLATAWRQLTRRLSRCGLAVFLVCAGIATVEAQKHAGTIVVDAAGDGDFTDLNTAINAVPSLEPLGCYFGDDPMFVDMAWRVAGPESRFFKVQVSVP